MQDQTELGRMIIAVAFAIRDDIGLGEIAQKFELDPEVVQKQAEFYIAHHLDPVYVLKQGRKLNAYATYRAILFTMKGVAR